MPLPVEVSRVEMAKPTGDRINAITVFTPSDKGTEVLTRIIGLDIARIRHYLKDLHDVHGVLEGSLSALESKIAGTLYFPPDGSAVAGFRGWVQRALVIRDLPPDPPPERLVTLILWALEAKRTYLACLKTAFSTNREPLPRWVYTILKLARYAIASMALLQLASDTPHLFNPMLVEPVVAPPQTGFTITEGELPLTSVLKRLVGGREADYVSRLTRIWGVTDSEAHFRKACSLTLPVHAEMQLLNFYDQHPERRPAFRFIGVSKKSCFLCQRFLASHPRSLSVSSCHQKLYLAWRPPPTTKSYIYKQYKSITTELSKTMEAAAKQELEGRMGHRRPVPPDSTTGVSLSGFAGFNLVAGSVQSGSEMIQGAGKGENFGAGRVFQAALTEPIEVIDRTSTEDEIPGAFLATAPTAKTLPVTEMVFHVMRIGDIERQDIIALGDVFDTHSRSPSWVKLLERLKDECGVAFKEAEEFLMVNDRIRVVNQRQFLACIQYLRNVMAWNSDVLVYSYNSRSLTSAGSRLSDG